MCLQSLPSLLLQIIPGISKQQGCDGVGFRMLSCAFQDCIVRFRQSRCASSRGASSQAWLLERPSAGLSLLKNWQVLFPDCSQGPCRAS